MSRKSKLKEILNDLKKQHKELGNELDLLQYDLEDTVFEQTLNEYNEIILRIEDIERELLYNDEENI